VPVMPPRVCWEKAETGSRSARQQHRKEETKRRKRDLCDDLVIP
jgi:hypothetical protein